MEEVDDADDGYAWWWGWMAERRPEVELCSAFAAAPLIHPPTSHTSYRSRPSTITIPPLRYPHYAYPSKKKRNRRKKGNG